MSTPVVVIGAGAAGIIAAWKAATLGARVVLLEKTGRLGTKILISGGGKCNITHDGPLEDLLRAFRPNEGRFIRPACYRFQNYEIVEMLTSRGLEVYTREDGRIFPTNGTAKDVVEILRQYLEEAGVDIRLDTPVTSILSAEHCISGVETPAEVVETCHVVLCTGGSSYPNTGTTGDGWAWAKGLGHRIARVRAALAPMYMELEGMDPRAGVALRDVVLKARQNGKEIDRWRNDLLFTHRGVSGPTVLGISRVVAERWEDGPVSLEIDILPEESFEDLSNDLKRWSTEQPRILVRTYLGDVVPKSLVSDLLSSAAIDEETPFAQLTQKARNRLVEVLKGWAIGRVRAVPLEKGEVVAGGVALDEVDPKTMRSLKCEGLYLAGEVLDIAGPVGGYNLQAAFATGFVAGETAALDSQS